MPTKQLEYVLYLLLFCVEPFFSLTDDPKYYIVKVYIKFIFSCKIIFYLTISMRTCSIVFQLVDHRVEFTKWWVTDFKTIKFPSAGTVFDYYIDPETKKFEHWTKKVPKFEYDQDIPLQVALCSCFKSRQIKFSSCFF